MAFDKQTLLIGKRIKSNSIMTWRSVILWVYERVYKMAKG